MENKSPFTDFSLIGAALDSDDKVARISAMSQIVALVTTRGDQQPFFLLPDATQLHRLIGSLSSILSESHDDIATNRAVRHTLTAIRSSITEGRAAATAMAMDPFACRSALHAIHCCWEDEAFGYILRDAADLRLLTVAAQRGALTIMRACLPRFFRGKNSNAAAAAAGDVRCVVAFTSLLSSPHTGVVRGAAEALASLSPAVPGLAMAVTKAYCDLLARTAAAAAAAAAASQLQISNVLIVLDQLQNLSSVIMESSGVEEEEEDMAMLVLRALTFRDFAVQQKILNLALSLVTPWNVDSMVVFLRNEMNNVAAAVTAQEYREALEKAIYACHGKYLKA